MNLPRIGVTGPCRGGVTAWTFTALAILRAGGWPRRITPDRPVSIEELDGLVMGGGADLNPALYGEEIDEALRDIRNDPVSKFQGLGKIILFPFIYFMRRLFSINEPFQWDANRDRTEVELFRKALQQDVPVLGICRGSQLINAVLGGNLHREIREFYTETPYVNTILPKKIIEIKSETLLASICPSSHYRVNALNHQAVRNIAVGLRECAKESNGLTQAIEHESKTFVLGVQWHPEYLPHLGAQQNIFRRLVVEAAACKKLGRRDQNS